MPATVWKGYLSFGLVTFPIRLYAAARPDPIRFHMLHQKDLSRVKEVFYCVTEDKPIERAEIVKGYEYAKNRYVVVEPEELKNVAPSTATAMQILQFVRVDEIDPIFFETSYYVAPEEAVSRSYSLLVEAMKETKFDAVAKIAMHGREHVVILRPKDRGMMLHTMYFVDELHKANEAKVPAATKFNKREVDLAKKLIETLAAPFKPEQFHDEYRQNVEELIQKKRKGQKITPINQPKRAPVIDLMQALQQSLAKKGGASKTAVGKADSQKTTRKRSTKVA